MCGRCVAMGMILTLTIIATLLCAIHKVLKTSLSDQAVVVVGMNQPVYAVILTETGSTLRPSPTTQVFDQRDAQSNKVDNWNLFG